MVSQEQLKDFERRLKELHGYLRIEEKRLDVKEDDLKSQDPTFWDKPKDSEVVLKRMRGKKLRAGRQSFAAIGGRGAGRARRP
jgi:peptide chain release factor 2